MAGWSWAAPNGPGDFPAQKHPWRPRSIISAASLSLVTLCLFPPLLSPRRDLAAGRDGVRRRHAAVDPIDAGPPRALADHQPRSVTISATASSSSSSLLILFSGAQINALLLGEPCTSWVVVSPVIFRFWEGFGL